MNGLGHFSLPSKPSLWVTRERPKIDRIACPWLVRRFVDPAAEFLYVPVERVFAVAKEANATPACGSPRTREPVAITTPFVAVCVSVLPSAVTFTDEADARTPAPLIHVTLFFLNRNSTPLEFWVLTARDRFIATP